VPDEVNPYDFPTLSPVLRQPTDVSPDMLYVPDPPENGIGGERLVV
jgi:hypothetical protein